MHGKLSGMLCVAAIATSCWRADVISLHGFFGDKSDIPQVRELIPAHGKPSSLPPFWKGELPLEFYGGDQFPFYLDPDKSHVPPGEDYREDYGLESSTLAFYSGEGDINGWFVPSGEQVFTSQVHVGDGALRYLWLHSCRVMAHGPKVGDDYGAPQWFKTRGGEVDVFRRWTPAFGPHLRMVCGGSTFLGYVEAGEIWSYLLESEISVTDSFVLGLAHGGQVPVCLTRGGQDPASSALADRTLHSDGVAQVGWLHLQYPVRCRVEHHSPTLYVSCGEPLVHTEGGEISTQDPNEAPAPKPEIIRTIPEVKIISPPPSAPLDGPLPLGFVRIAGNDRLKFQVNSKAKVLIKRRDRYSRLDRCDRETYWTFQPDTLLAWTGLDSEAFLSASSDADNTQGSADDALTALEMRVESRKDGEASGQCRARSLFLLLRNKVDVGTKSKPEPYPIFGPATVLELQWGAKGRPVLASFSEPYHSVRVAKEEKPVNIKPSGEVIREAYQALQLKPEEYSVDAARAVLGYERAPLRCSQESLRPTYEIQFFPTAAAQHDRPTVIVRRDARRDTSKASWTCSDWGEGEEEPKP